MSVKMENVPLAYGFDGAVAGIGRGLWALVIS